MPAISSGPTGTLGGQQVNGGASDMAGIASWIGMIPNSMLFLGLSFGMIITINFASFCRGRALQAFNILTLPPPIDNGVTTLIDTLSLDIRDFRKLLDAHNDVLNRLPFDLKAKFSREASHAAWKIVQGKLPAARRKFGQKNDPLAALTPDPEAETISSSFANEEAFSRHLADQMDVLRMHNVLRVLSGLNTNLEEEKP